MNEKGLRILAGIFFAVSLWSLGTSAYHFYRDPNSLFGAGTLILGLIFLGLGLAFAKDWRY